MSSSLPQAVGLGLAYVAGMVSPLVLMALLWERFDLSNNVIVRGRPLAVRFGPMRWTVHSSNLFAGILFLFVGSLLIVSTFLGGLEAPQSQTRLGESLRSIADILIRATSGLPDAVFAALLALAVLYIAVRAFRPHARAARQSTRIGARPPGPHEAAPREVRRSCASRRQPGRADWRIRK